MGAINLEFLKEKYVCMLESNIIKIKEMSKKWILKWVMILNLNQMYHWNFIYIIKIIKWILYSSDLNPIENMWKQKEVYRNKNI